MTAEQYDTVLGHIDDGRAYLLFAESSHCSFLLACLERTEESTLMGRVYGSGLIQNANVEAAAPVQLWLLK